MKGHLTRVIAPTTTTLVKTEIIQTFRNLISTCAVPSPAALETPLKCCRKYFIFLFHTIYFCCSLILPNSLHHSVITEERTNSLLATSINKDTSSILLWCMQRSFLGGSAKIKLGFSSGHSHSRYAHCSAPRRQVNALMMLRTL